jgi:hypothetical protein
MCAAEFFRQRPNFLVDLAEIIFQELATLARNRVTTFIDRLGILN